MNHRIRDYCVTPRGCTVKGCSGDCIVGFQLECDRREEADSVRLTLPELDALSMRADCPIGGCRNQGKPGGEPCYRAECSVTLQPWPTIVDALRKEKGSGHIEPLPETATKDTNPKDAIGISKAPLSTVPMNVIAELGVAMLEGASKYGRHNYRAAGVRASVYFDALMRHAVAWWEGEDMDPDSGLSHVTKAIATLVVLRDAMSRGLWTDDRPPRSAAFYADLNARAAKLIAKHADKKPHHYTQADPVAVPIGKVVK